MIRSNYQENVFSSRLTALVTEVDVVAEFTNCSVETAGSTQTIF